MTRKPTDRDLEEALEKLREQRREKLEGANEDEDGSPVGDLTRKQAEQIAAISGDGTTADEILERHRERSEKDPDERPDPTRTVRFNAAEKSEEAGDGLSDEQHAALGELGGRREYRGDAGDDRE